MTILSGMSRLEQVVDNVDTLTGFDSLDETKLAILREARERTLSSQAVGCTSCRYCMPCPYGVDIEGNFRVYNDWAGELGLLNQPQKAPAEKKQAFLRHYNNAIAKKGRVDMCSRCGKCQPLCPQHIKIPVELGKVEALVELCRLGMHGGQGRSEGSEV